MSPLCIQVVAIFVMMAFNESDVAKDKKAGRKDE